MTRPDGSSASGQTSMPGQEEFLTRVRMALGERAGAALAEEPPTLVEDLVRRCHADTDLAQRFTESARAVGMQVQRTSAERATDAVRDFLASHGCRSATVSVSDPELSDVLRAAAGSADCAVADWRQTPGLGAQFDVDAGITDVALAIAETGSIVIRSGSESCRGSHLVPPLHIAIVRAEQIVADLVDCLQRLHGENATMQSAAIVLITGPSKTADIEGVLITGVHGPGEVQIVLIESATNA